MFSYDPKANKDYLQNPLAFLKVIKEIKKRLIQLNGKSKLRTKFLSVINVSPS